MKGDELKRMLVDLGWSQAELAGRISTNQNTVSRWVNGQSRVPGSVVAYLELLAKIKGVLD